MARQFQLRKNCSKYSWSACWLEDVQVHYIPGIRGHSHVMRTQMNSPLPIQPGGANLSAGKIEDHASSVVSKPFPLDEAKPAGRWPKVRNPTDGDAGIRLTR